jgi:hypothetical protein
MTAYDGRPIWVGERRPPVDDAYAAWFNAQSRCTQALRAWSGAARADRARTYRRYVVELALEEAAARRLAELHEGLTAA